MKLQAFIALSVNSLILEYNIRRVITRCIYCMCAKVFRTYNASVTLETELPTTESMAGMSVQEKVAMYNAANRQVAILCNHQKTVSKAAETMFEALNEKLTVLNRQKKELTE